MSPSLPDRPLDEPLCFKPYFRPQVWGGRRLQELLGKPLPTEVPVGESWELSVQPLHVSRVSDGPWAGCSLQQLWDDRRTELLGTAASAPVQFPWLIKWLDCHELLSVQVHPDDAAAQRMLGEPFGKTESWVVIHAEPTAKIYAGLKSGVTRDELARRSQDGTVAECLHGFTPQVGDCVHIPAGTVHAVGGGVLMAEVQQTSDATFRLFDWNRVDASGKPRQLHLEQALECIDFQRGPVNPVRTQTHLGQEMLVRCPYFHLDRIRLTSDWPARIDRLTAVMILDGEATLTSFHNHQGQHLHLQQGDTVLIPAAVHNVIWSPQLDKPSPTMLIVTSP